MVWARASGSTTSAANIWRTSRRLSSSSLGPDCTGGLDQVEHPRRQFNVLRIHFEAVADRLECDSAAKFIEAYDRLLAWLESRRQTVLGHTGAFGS